MIKSLASSKHKDRVRALKNDFRISVSVHESGHELMLKMHGLQAPVHLPAIVEKQGVTDLDELASAPFNARGLSLDAIGDICFGGYCAESAIYDERHLSSGRARIYVNADRAANDLIAFVRRSGMNGSEATNFTIRLLAGGQQAGEAVHDLYLKYGKRTYAKMRAHRTEMLDIAQQIFDFWQAHDFRKCEWQCPT